MTKTESVLQKLGGIALMLIGILSERISGDATAMIMLFILGLPVVLTKEKA